MRATARVRVRARARVTVREARVTVRFRLAHGARGYPPSVCASVRSIHGAAMRSGAGVDHLVRFGLGLGLGLGLG